VRHRVIDRPAQGGARTEHATPAAVALRWGVLLPATVALLEASARSFAPFPYAGRLVDWTIGGEIYSLAAVPALAALACGRWGRRAASVLVGLPVGLACANFEYGARASAGVPHTILATFVLGCVVGVAAGRLRARHLICALAGLVLVLGGRRWLLAPRRADAERPSVLLVVLDTTSTGHLSLYGYEKPTSPRLEALAARSLVFRRAVSPAPWTVPAHGSIFSGLYPSEMGFDGDGFHASPSAGSLALDLEQQGWSAYGISANPIVSPMGELRLGFRHLWAGHALLEPLLSEVAGRLRHLRDHGTFGVHGGRITDLALDWLDRLSPRGQPFFLFLNYIDPHYPYRPLPPHRARFAPGVGPHAVEDDIRLYNSGRVPLADDARLALTGLYDAEIAEMDEAVGRLLDELARRGFDASNLLLVVTADHGESLGDHGIVGHLLTMNDVVLHVPLLLSGPGVSPGVVDEPVQTVQLRATVRALLGMPPVPGLAPALLPWGESPKLIISEKAANDWYVEEMKGFPLSPEFALRDGDWTALERDHRKVIFDDHGHGATYDLAADPDENHPGPLADGEELVREYNQRRVVAGTPHAHVVPDQLRRALESLGYVGR